MQYPSLPRALDKVLIPDPTSGGAWAISIPRKYDPSVPSLSPFLDLQEYLGYCNHLRELIGGYQDMLALFGSRLLAMEDSGSGSSTGEISSLRALLSEKDSELAGLQSQHMQLSTAFLELEAEIEALTAEVATLRARPVVTGSGFPSHSSRSDSGDDIMLVDSPSLVRNAPGIGPVPGTSVAPSILVGFFFSFAPRFSLGSFSYDRFCIFLFPGEIAQVLGDFGEGSLHSSCIW